MLLQAPTRSLEAYHRYLNALLSGTNIDILYEILSHIGLARALQEKKVASKTDSIWVIPNSKRLYVAMVIVVYSRV
jgi:hypothetical protein